MENSIDHARSPAISRIQQKLPRFMCAHTDPLEPGKVNWIDGWAVQSTGDIGVDQVLGEAFALEVTSLANEQNNPGLVTFAISSILAKGFKNQLTSECTIEHAFISKLVRMACAGSRN